MHGHWSYARNGNMCVFSEIRIRGMVAERWFDCRIVNFFYKNMICIGVLWWFQIYCSWSAQ